MSLLRDFQTNPFHFYLVLFFNRHGKSKALKKEALSTEKSMSSRDVSLLT